MLQTYLNSLTDDIYSKCKVTDTVIRLPVDITNIPDEFASSQLDATLTPEKAIYVSAQYLKTRKPVTEPLLKLADYYVIKRP